MSKFIGKYCKGGVTRISKETERAFFFYATMVVVVMYLAHRLF